MIHGEIYSTSPSATGRGLHDTLEGACCLLRRLVRRETHTLPDGVKLELLHHPADADRATEAGKPPLLFIHGSGHAAWCWEVRHAALLCSRRTRHGQVCT